MKSVTPAALIVTLKVNFFKVPRHILVTDSVEIQNLTSKFELLTISDAASAPTSPFRLLALPRELRDLIYEHTFDVDVEIAEHMMRDLKPKPPKRNAGLTLVSKQVYEETIDLYYATSRFFSYELLSLMALFTEFHPVRSKITHVKYMMVVHDDMTAERKNKTVSRQVQQFFQECGIPMQPAVKVMKEREIDGSVVRDGTFQLNGTHTCRTFPTRLVDHGFQN